MKHAINVKVLEQSALAAHTVFLQNRDSRLDWLLDRHFVVEHLAPTLLYRLQAHLPMGGGDLVELWAEHLGLSDALLEKWKSRLEPLFAEYLKLLASELRTHTQNPHLLHRILSRTG